MLQSLAAFVKVTALCDHGRCNKDISIDDPFCCYLLWSFEVAVHEDSELGRIPTTERRAKNIIGTLVHGKVLAPIVKTLHKQSCITVRKCLDGRSNVHQF